MHPISLPDLRLQKAINHCESHPEIFAPPTPLIKTATTFRSGIASPITPWVSGATDIPVATNISATVVDREKHIPSFYASKSSECSEKTNKMPTPIKVNTLESLLEGYDTKKSAYLINEFQNSFSLNGYRLLECRTIFLRGKLLHTLII